MHKKEELQTMAVSGYSAPTHIELAGGPYAVDLVLYKGDRTENVVLTTAETRQLAQMLMDSTKNATEPVPRGFTGPEYEYRVVTLGDPKYPAEKTRYQAETTLNQAGLDGYRLAFVWGIFGIFERIWQEGKES